MTRLQNLCDAHGITIVEDAAQGLGSSVNGTPLGTSAPLAAISFHETKNIHCGLGGCLIVNDEDLATRAEIIWERGTNRSAFFKGLVDKYSWVEVGSSFYPSEFQAAFLLAQLESLEENLIKRRGIWNSYSAALTTLEDRLQPEARVQQLMASRNCFTCHIRGEIDGVAGHQDDFQTHDASIGQDGRLPPTLTGVGGKLQQLL